MCIRKAVVSRQWSMVGKSKNYSLAIMEIMAIKARFRVW